MGWRARTGTERTFDAKQTQEPELLRGWLDLALDELANLDFFGLDRPLGFVGAVSGSTTGSGSGKVRTTPFGMPRI